MELVIIESPYRAAFPKERARNDEYLKLCIFDSIQRGEAPFASHGFYTQFLKNNDPKERELGIQLGFKWGEKADLRVFYVDFGVSKGMTKGLKEALYLNQTIDIRNLPYEVMKNIKEEFPPE